VTELENGGGHATAARLIISVTVTLTDGGQIVSYVVNFLILSK
jgi:hypothetical protein